MASPRVNINLLSESVKKNLERVLMASSGTPSSESPRPQKVSHSSARMDETGKLVDSITGEQVKTYKKGRGKYTLTPDIATQLVKSVKVSENGNEIKILMALNLEWIPTAQGKGAFVDKAGNVHFFTKPKQRKADEAFKIALSPYAHLTRSWGDVPVEVEFRFFVPYPESTPKKHRHKIGPHTTRPDGDNAIKAPLDQLTKAGFWKDDSYINTYHIYKRRTTGTACTLLKITNLQPKFEALYQETGEYESPTLFNQSKDPIKPSEINPLQDLLTTSNSDKDIPINGM